MARWPAPGRCKSRLALSVGAARAAAIQQRLQAHALAVLAQAQPACRCNARLALAGVALGGAARLARPAGVEVVLQGQGSLGLRMQRQFAHGFRQGYRQVVLIGSDLPHLGLEDLQQAYAALEQCPAVLAPAHDGGYWLVGLTRPAPALFAGIAWGTDQVLEQSLRQALSIGLPLRQLHRQGDLDRGSDLLPWR